jgi:aldose sugar dehydrogenase
MTPKLYRHYRYVGSCSTLLTFPLLILCTLLILATIVTNVGGAHYNEYFVYAGNEYDEGRRPYINDPSLGVEVVFAGVKSISNFAFLGPNDILYLERLEGHVKRLVNGVALPEPLLDLNVADNDGLLGIATAKNENTTYVFLYYTESERGDGGERVGNRLYRYEMKDNELLMPKLLLNLPVEPGPMHHGGELIMGPEGDLYVAIGDIDGWRNDTTKTQAQNYDDGPEPDGRAGILRITQDGEVVGDGLLGDERPLNLYYAYGIRNSFGMDFDPLTGNLWDTENGPEYGDEINLVEPGFNSGYEIVKGKSTDDFDVDELIDFGGKGKYSEPEFSWGTEEQKYTVAPTALKFLNSNKLGEEYENDMFVGDANNGNIYHFDLNDERTGLLMKGSLEDNLATNLAQLEDIILGREFGGITDLQVGPDGYLYVLCQLERDQGAILKIYPVIPT